MLGHHLCGRSELRSAGETVHHLGGQVGRPHCHTGRSVRTAPPKGIPAAGVSHRVGLGLGLGLGCRVHGRIRGVLSGRGLNRTGKDRTATVIAFGI